MDDSGASSLAVQEVVQECVRLGIVDEIQDRQHDPGLAHLFTKAHFRRFVQGGWPDRYFFARILVRARGVLRDIGSQKVVERKTRGSGERDRCLLYTSPSPRD